MRKKLKQKQKGKNSKLLETRFPTLNVDTTTGKWREIADVMKRGTDVSMRKKPGGKLPTQRTWIINSKCDIMVLIGSVMI